MSNVVLDISMSLDGFVTGPKPGLDSGLGEGGERLHDWAVGAKTEADAALLDQAVANTGAVLMDRRTFDIVDGPHGWAEDMGYGAERDQSSPPPMIVVTSSAPATVRLASMFTFVTDGIESALQRARAAAGDKDVIIMGGANLGRQYLAAGLLDEVRIHLAPVVLGAGTPLFDRARPCRWRWSRPTWSSPMPPRTCPTASSRRGVDDPPPRARGCREKGHRRQLLHGLEHRRCRRATVGVARVLRAGRVHRLLLGLLARGRCAEIFQSRLPEARDLGTEQMRPPEPLRLYRATVTEHSVLIRGGDPEHGRGIDSRMVLDMGR